LTIDPEKTQIPHGQEKVASFAQAANLKVTTYRRTFEG